MNRTYEIYNHEGELIESGRKDITWQNLRQKRNDALTNSDWRFMSDQSPSQEWIDYRVFLRDLPQNYPGDNGNAAYDAWVEYEKPEGAE